ncbi:MAG: RDD family protein, partial [Terracidiphilus sp.]
MEQNSDQLSIDTPELVAIQMPLAGIGSRFIALLIDTLIWVAAILVLALMSWLLVPGITAFSKVSAQWAVAIYVLVLFLLNWGYFTLFEAFWGGRTPGKRVARIRVIQQSGRPIGLFESMARNFIRYVDQIPFFYAVGVIAMFSTRQHQRLGDLAAGTLVVLDREQEAPLWGQSGV